MGKLKRSALLHYLQDPSSTGSSPKHYLVGKDVEDASVELNPDVESIKNILDEVSVNDKGYDPSMDVETYYANPDDGWFYEWIKNIAMNRLTGDDCKTVYTEVLVDKTPDEAKGSYDAWQEDVIVKPQSYGGAQGGISIPFNIAFCGNRVQGTATLGTKLSLGSFSANSATTTSTTNS
ncbi:MAG: hypothetical protein ACI4I7_05475 [Oscillospiraceae bacterium]